MIKPFSILRLTCVVGSLALSAETQAHPGHTDSNGSNSNTPNPQNLSYDELDNDAYAIPLDSSRREIDEEEEELEALEQENLHHQQK